MGKRISFFIVPFLVLCLSACQSTFVDKNFHIAEKQTEKLLTMLGDTEKLPRSFKEDEGTLVNVKIEDWTSGFFPGVLWYLYDYTKKDSWKEAAIKQTEKLHAIQHYNGHHDVGFMMYCSYGNGYRLTGEKSYEEILINTANALCSRFNKQAGIIRSWDFHRSRSGDEWHGPVIIDNMMNLELLFFATKLTGNPYYSNIAISHADSTLKYHLRPDYSCYHVVNYDTITGLVTGRGTHQGYSDPSAWARGQAWGIYGFTVMYRETKDLKYLDIAEKMADFYLTNPNMPEDLVPYWDFNAPDIPAAPRDASAAAIAASALIELSDYSTRGKQYFEAAKKTITSLANNYASSEEDSNPFILKHSVGNYPRGIEVDVPLNYADYYYLEALLRYNRKK